MVIIVTIISIIIVVLVLIIVITKVIQSEVCQDPEHADPLALKLQQWPSAAASNINLQDEYLPFRQFRTLSSDYFMQYSSL